MKEKKKSNPVKLVERPSNKQKNENPAKNNLKSERETINKESRTS